MSHFNKLTPAEAERLSLLLEECGEVLQAIGKIQRHGYASRYPKNGLSNRAKLEDEVGHVLAAVLRLERAGDLDGKMVTNSGDSKLAEGQYLHHQEAA